MPLACLEVVGVVPRGDLERPRAKLGCDRVVGDDRDEPSQHRQSHPLALRSRVTLVRRIHRNRRVAEQRLRTGRCDGQVPGAVLVEIADVVQVALHLLVFDLKVGQRGTATDAPVDHPLAAVDESFVVEVLERRADGAGRAFVQRKRLALPVARRAKPAVLVVYRVAGLVHPLPDTFEERFTSDVVTRQFLCGELALNDDLRGDTRVVGARQVEGHIALHAVIAGERVLDRGRHRVA